MTSTEYAHPVDTDEFPVSSGQASLLVLDRMFPGSGQYHVPTGFEVRGRFDLAAFTTAYRELVARHDALRTTFATVDGETRQVVAATADATVEVTRDVTAGEVGDAMRADAARPFDLETGPLARCTVYAVTDGSHRVLLTVHHLVSDGWSAQIMLRELAAGYRAALAGQPDPVPEPPIQYPDYAAWQADRLRTGEYAAAIDHWRTQLHDAPTTLALPADRPRPAVQSAAGGTELLVLPAQTQDRLAAIARDRGATPFAVLYAAYAAFLSRLSHQTDLVIGVPDAGRDHPDVQSMVGLFTNTLAVRTDVSGGPAFTALVDRVRDTLRGALPYREAPFSAVIDAVAPERDSGHDPLVQVVFGYDDDTELVLDLPDAQVRRIEVALDVAKFDFLLHVERWGPDLVARLNYRTDLYAPATVAHWSRCFQTMLAALLARPETAITDVVLLDPEQHRLAVGEAVPATGPVPLVPDLVAERAAERPDATALVSGATVLTYRELLERADRLADGLRRAGVGPDVPVGVCLPRSPAMVLAALAVLRAGGAYIPLDPGQPEVRLRQMLADADAHLVLVAEGTDPDLGVPAAAVRLDASDFAVPPPAADPVSADPVSADPVSADPVSADPVAHPRLDPRHTAYLLFTSGSTGRPKAVAVEHRALTNLVTAVRPQFPVTGDDRVLQYVAYGFDVSVSDLFFTWVAGAELHLAGDDERLGDPLYQRLAESRITYVFLPPSAAMSLPCPPDALPELRLMAVGGEPCPATLVDRWATPRRRILDAYGPSEATVYATLADLRPDEPVVIGRPVANTRTYVLDARLRPVPVGVVGEIYLSGASLGRGYANRPGLTAGRFVADPYGPPGSRMYRTGDLGRYDADGVISYLGRTDSQVKVRGFRVELGEIEAALTAHPGVSDAAVTVHGDGGDARLAGYVVATGDTAPGLPELRAWLGARLPGYMVPESIAPLAELPLGRTGKVDRSRLPRPSSDRPDLGSPEVAPGTDTERRLARIWCDVLELDQVGVHDNFFDLGGNSIRLLDVQTALRTGGDAPLTMLDLFRHPTVASLADHLDGRAAASPEADRADSRRRGSSRRERLAQAARHRAGGQPKGGTE